MDIAECPLMMLWTAPALRHRSALDATCHAIFIYALLSAELYLHGLSTRTRSNEQFAGAKKKEPRYGCCRTARDPGSNQGALQE